MNSSDRLRYLRKELLHLTLEQFGNRIGLKKNSLSQIENGKNSLTDQNIISICREFGVREDWLRTGEGEPFGSQTRNQEIQAFANDVMSEEDESFRKRFVAALAKLDLSEWEVLEKFAKNVINSSDEH